MFLISDILTTELVLEKDFFDLSITNILSYISLFLIIFICYKYVDTHNLRITGFIYLFIIIYVILIMINFKLSSNVYFSEKYITPENIFDKLNTGDLVFFRCYEYNNLGTGIYWGLPLLQKKYYFTHAGMIFKNNKNKNKVYIIESNAIAYYCSLSEKIKSGFQMNEFINRINTANPYRIHIVQSNLHQFIDHEKFDKSLIKYKDYNFFQDGIYCLNLVTKILQENELLKDDSLIPYLFDDLIEPKNYNVPVVFNEPIMIKNIYY